MEGLVPRFELDTPRVNSEAPIGLIKKTSTNKHNPTIRKIHGYKLLLQNRHTVTKKCRTVTDYAVFPSYCYSKIMKVKNVTKSTTCFLQL